MDGKSRRLYSIDNTGDWAFSCEKNLQTFNQYKHLHLCYTMHDIFNLFSFNDGDLEVGKKKEDYPGRGFKMYWHFICGLLCSCCAVVSGNHPGANSSQQRIKAQESLSSFEVQYGYQDVSVHLHLDVPESPLAAKAGIKPWICKKSSANSNQATSSAS